MHLKTVHKSVPGARGVQRTVHFPRVGCEQKQIRHVSELIFKCLTNYFSA